MKLLSIYLLTFLAITTYVVNANGGGSMTPMAPANPAPTEEEVLPEEEVPAKEEHMGGDKQSEHPAPTEEEVLPEEEVPAKEETPAKEEHPAPTEEEVLPEEEVPAKEETPAKEEHPAPTEEEVLPEEEVPAKEETPKEQPSHPQPTQPEEEEVLPEEETDYAPQAAEEPTPTQPSEPAPQQAELPEEEEPETQPTQSPYVPPTPSEPAPQQAELPEEEEPETPTQSPYVPPTPSEPAPQQAELPEEEEPETPTQSPYVPPTPSEPAPQQAELPEEEEPETPTQSPYVPPTPSEPAPQEAELPEEEEPETPKYVPPTPSEPAPQQAELPEEEEPETPTEPNYGEESEEPAPQQAELPEEEEPSTPSTPSDGYGSSNDYGSGYGSLGGASVPRPNGTIVDIGFCNQNYLIYGTIAQTFTARADGDLQTVRVFMKPHACYETRYHVELREGESLTGTVLEKSASVSMNSSMSAGASRWVDFKFNNLGLTGGSKYTWVLISEASHAGAVSICQDVYAGGFAFGTNGQKNILRDLSFGIVMSNVADCGNSNCLAQASCVSGSTDAETDTCQCPDGQIGDGTRDGTGCSYECPLPTKLETIGAPTLNSGLSGIPKTDTLEIVWDVPTVQTRTQPKIEFLTSEGEVASGCTHATAYKIEDAGKCLKRITITMPWSDATAKCGFYMSGQIGAGIDVKDVYSVRIRMTSEETVEDKSGSAIAREIVNEFQLSLTFDTMASLSTDIKVFSTCLIDAVLTKQHYGTEKMGEGFFEFQTKVGYPFQLVLKTEGGAMGSAPTTINSTKLISLSSTVAAGLGEFSTQTWKLTVVPKDTTCELDGVYNTADDQFELTCTEAAIAAGDCPEDYDFSVAFSFTLDSSNFCGQIIADVGVVLSLQTFKDSTFTEEKDVFFLGDKEKAYFHVNVKSSPQVSVESIQVLRVTLSSRCSCMGGVPHVLYDKEVTAEGDNYDFELLDSDSFTLGLGSNINIDRNSFESMTVVALCQVNYKGNDGTITSKRALLQEDVDGEHTEGSGTHTFTVTFGDDDRNSAASLASLFTFALIAITALLQFF